MTHDRASLDQPEDNRGLQELLSALRASKSMETAMRAIAQAMYRMTESAHASVRLIDPSEKRLLFAARSGRALQRVAESRSSLTRLDDRVIEARKAVLLDTAACDGLFDPDQSGHWTPSTVLAEPLLYEDHCLGLLTIARETDRPYVDRDRALLQMLATIAEPYVAIARLRELASLDSLTGLFNRYQLDECGPALLRAALKDARPLTAVMIDLNGFSEVNNLHGHPTGDEVLRLVGRALRRASRGGDIVARYGGDEFLILALDADKAAGFGIAMRLSHAISEEPVPTDDGAISITASLGVASLRQTDTLESLVTRADKALLQAKQLRRRFKCASRVDTDGW